MSTATFATLLRQWRHVRGLSQLELAVRADTTQRHLSFLEQGRSQPGRAIALRLGEALAVPPRQLNCLLEAAGYVPVYSSTTFDEEKLRPVRDALDEVLVGHLPYLAVITRPLGVAVAGNRAMGLLTQDAAEHLLTSPVNLFRLALHPAGLAHRIENLDEWGRHVLAAVRSKARADGADESAALAAELSGYLPETPPGKEPVGFLAPLRLRTDHGVMTLLTTRTVFATASDVALFELELEAFLPADRATAKLLRDGDDERRQRREPPTWTP